MYDNEKFYFEFIIEKNVKISYSNWFVLENNGVRDVFAYAFRRCQRLTVDFRFVEFLDTYNSERAENTRSLLNHKHKYKYKKEKNFRARRDGYDKFVRCVSQ